MLRTHTYLSSSNSVLHCVTFSCASKCRLRCWRRTFESSPTTGHHVGYAEFPHPLVQQYEIIIYMFSSSSPPRYIGWILRFGRPPYQHAPASDPLLHVDAKTAQLQTPCQTASFRPLPLGLKLTCFAVRTTTCQLRCFTLSNLSKPISPPRLAVWLLQQPALVLTARANARAWDMCFYEG